MVEELLKVLRFHAVEDVKKIVPGWSLVLWINVGEILHEFTVLLEIRPQCLDGYFIVVRDMDVIDLLLLEQLLLLSEHEFEEVLVDASLIGQVKLHWKGISKKEN